MFTGIIEGVGRLLAKKKSGQGLTFELECGFPLTDPKEGESIACGGVCLTAYTIRGNRFAADVSPETLSRTKLGKLSVGDAINMERALRLTDRLGGHLVSGHVDCLATVRGREPVGDYTVFTFSMDSRLSKYVIEKGSITIDGVSLTVNSCAPGSFSVSIIPHTLKVTTLGLLKPGHEVNIEVDVIGKYIESLLRPGQQAGGEQGASAITEGFLAQHGFL